MAGYKGKTKITANPEKREIVAERTFDAPRELVWKAWTEPERLSQWWGPRNWNTTIKEFDLKPGGAFFYVMNGPDGLEAWSKSIYQEIVPPERLVYLDTFADKEGKSVPGTPRMIITTEFFEDNGKTRVISHSVFDSDKDFKTVLAMGVEEGLAQTWDRLGELLGEE